MRIGIDIRCLGEGRRTGVEEYALNLLHNLFSIDKKNEYVLFLNSFKKTGNAVLDFSKYKNVSIKTFRWPNKMINFLFWYLNFPKIDKMLGGVDILFFPNIIFAAASRKTKVILTVHDLSFEHFPETFSWKRRLWHWFINPRKLCQKADGIIAVSESTKKDIEEIYKIKPEKISVVYSGARSSFKSIDRNDQKLLTVKEKYNLPYKFMLYLGTIEPRKNIVGIIRAYNQLRNIKHPELAKYKLVIAGERGWKSEKIFSEIGKSPFGEDIIFTGFVADEDKPAIYNLASLFVYPSFFEGFGFPPLEAMACGVPVITSNNSSLPEVAGAAAILIDPDKPDEIYQAMKEILLSRNLQESLRKKGFEQVKKFEWKKTAEEFLKVIICNSVRK
jgi:glycosyltransferase involved in cell wall biosynthesis